MKSMLKDLGPVVLGCALLVSWGCAGETMSLSPDMSAEVAADPVDAGPAEKETADVEPSAADPMPMHEEVVVPAGTTLSVELESTIASDVSRVEDLVRARLTEAVRLGDDSVIPAGSPIRGSVIGAEASGKMKGRARLVYRFDEIQIDDAVYEIQTEAIRHEAEGTKADDAKKIGIGAAAGALIGGITGGKKGAAAGTAIGGGAGTAVVLSTSGDEVVLRAGSQVRVRLAEPVTIERLATH